MRKGGIDKGVVLLLVMVLVLAATGVSVALAVRTDAISELVSDDGQLASLLTVELGDGRLVTHLFLYQFSTRRGAVFHVPSHTGVVVRSLNRVDSIDTTYFAGGINAYRQQISELFGTSIPYHIHLDEAGLEAVIDLLGGISVFVTDLPNEGPEAVRIPNGEAVLDGAKAIQYLRYEGEGEREQDRIVRRQKLIIALLEELAHASDTLAGRSGAAILGANIATNLDRAATEALIRELSGLDRERMITRQIEGLSRLVATGDREKLLLFPHQEGRWLREAVRQIVDNLATAEEISEGNLVIRLEILNGTEIGGLASRTAEIYRSYGFDVISVGNASSSEIARTLVLDRVGSGTYARRAADIIRARRLEADADPQSAVDVTVILGRDFDGRYVR
jgi:polyisoprenyl-teichoic acid--peptidoglycan teichoic acid transferase